ncbi:MAG TPA: DegT/DnrJ/EryC1/StrS family aminotransferase, partial [Actinomycetota bacterium]|nr:DegT/DnrJ/EryC1/StrS family aminotransferase [Actinomycetota bacterium]
RLSELRALAAAHGLLLVEDAACSLGATYDGRPAGSFGVGCFSFHPRKSITTGEGGALTSDDAGFADRARMLRSHGGASGEFYQHFVAPGFNYRMSEIQAALGIAGIARLDEILAGRRAAAARYDAALEHLPVQTPAAHANATHTYQTYAVLLGEGIDRDDVIRRMRARDVETTLGTYAVHAEPYMEALGYRPGELAQSYAAYKRTLALPLWSQITPDEQDQVVEALRDALKEASS